MVLVESSKQLSTIYRQPHPIQKEQCSEIIDLYTILWPTMCYSMSMVNLLRHYAFPNKVG